MRHQLALLALLSSLAALPAAAGIDTSQYENKVVGYANGKPLYVKVNPNPGNHGQSGGVGKPGNQGHVSTGQHKPTPQHTPQHPSQGQTQGHGTGKGGARPANMSQRVNCGPSCQSYGWGGGQGGWNYESGSAWSGNYGNGYNSGNVSGSSYLDGYSYGYTPQEFRCRSGPSNSSHGRWSGYLNYGRGGYGWTGQSGNHSQVPQRVFGPGFVHPFPAAAAAGYSSIPRYGRVTGIPRYAP